MVNKIHGNLLFPRVSGLGLEVSGIWGGVAHGDPVSEKNFGANYVEEWQVTGCLEAYGPCLDDNNQL